MAFLFREDVAKQEFREYAFPNGSLRTKEILPRSRVGSPCHLVTLSPCHLVTLSLLSKAADDWAGIFQFVVVVFAGPEHHAAGDFRGLPAVNRW